MKLILLYLTTITILLSSCSPKKDFQELHDSDLTIQTIRLPVNNGTIGFKVRLIPSSRLLSFKKRQEIWYHADSCFSLVVGKAKINASMIQPVANGVNNSFEYLVVFDRQSLTANTEMYFVYNDHFFNHKVYNFLPFKI